jgi:hypothetical protein
MHKSLAGRSYENLFGENFRLLNSLQSDRSERLEAFIFPRKVIRRVLANTERAFLTASSSESSRRGMDGEEPREEEKTEQRDLRCQRPGKNLTRRSNCKLHKVQEVSSDAIAAPPEEGIKFSDERLSLN